MKIKNSILMAMAGLMMAGGMAGSAAAQSSNQSSGGTIVIGEDDTLTGPLAVFGVPQNNAIKLAVQQINNHGGLTVAGKKYNLKLIALDDQANSTIAVSNIKKLVDVDHAQFLAGFVGGAFVQPAFPFIEQNKIPTLVGTAADRSITAAGNPYVFHDRVPTDYSGIVSGQFMGKNFHVKRLAILGDFSQQFQWDLVHGVQKGLQQKGGKVTSIQNIPNTSADATSQITAALATNPDTLYVFSTVDAAAFIVKQARQFGFKGRIIAFSGGSAQQWEKIVPNSMMQGIYQMIPAEIDPATPQINGPYAKQFLSLYQKTYNQQATPNTGYGFDLIEALAAAIKRANSLQPEAVVKALHSIPVPKDTTLKWIPVNGHMFDQNGQAYIPNAVFKFSGQNWKYVEPLPSPVQQYSAGLAASAAATKK